MGTIFPASNFYNAQNAFIVLYDWIVRQGLENGNGTRIMYNCGFYIKSPTERDINVEWRNWNRNYAMREWRWYLSENRSVEEIKKFAPIWDRMHNGDNLVNSNYGFLWNEGDQLEKCISQLGDDHETRQAWLTIFDGKNKDDFAFDTPCTQGIGFSIVDNKLCMNVNMRSNDLWYGFCNDQFCFSMLQQMVAERLNLKVGWYYHFAANMHLYERHYNSCNDFYKNLKEE